MPLPPKNVVVPRGPPLRNNLNSPNAPMTKEKTIARLVVLIYSAAMGEERYSARSVAGPVTAYTTGSNTAAKSAEELPFVPMGNTISTV